MRFNINDEVRVKLTPLGRKIHRDNHEWRPYHPPKEDAEGWSTWQLWVLMAEFGSRIRNGTEIPFEPEIDIPG